MELIFPYYTVTFVFYLHNDKVIEFLVQLEISTNLRNVSCSCGVVQAKSKAQNDWGNRTSMPFLISTGGWVRIGAALPKNGYVYL